MNQSVYVDYAINSLSDLFAEQLSGKADQSTNSVDVVAQKLVEKFGIPMSEAKEAADKAFKHWVSIYDPC